MLLQDKCCFCYWISSNTYYSLLFGYSVSVILFDFLLNRNYKKYFEASKFFSIDVIANHRPNKYDRKHIH